MAITTGTRIGPYEILCPIGSGGMGVVYRARDIRLGRSVAIKTLPPKCARDPSRLKRFELEAKALSSINHPNIITVYALGDEADSCYIVMEFVDGQTLRQQVAGKRMGLRAVLDVGSQVASALSAAHSAGIVHRDIKPENVMVRSDGLVKVLDFGLAKLMQPRALSQMHPVSPWMVNQDTLSLDGVEPEILASYVTVPNDEPPADFIQRRILGTARYMSPEYLCGREVDARTDIFSLGVMLYELIGGVAPFGGHTLNEISDAVLWREPVPLSHYQPGLPADLEYMISKALRKDRDCRYQDIKDFLIDLRYAKQEQQREATLRPSLQYEVINQAQATIAGGPCVSEMSQPGLLQPGLSVVSQTLSLPSIILPELTNNGVEAKTSQAGSVEISLIIRVERSFGIDGH